MQICAKGKSKNSFCTVKEVFYVDYMFLKLNLFQVEIARKYPVLSSFAGVKTSAEFRYLLCRSFQG